MRILSALLFNDAVTCAVIHVELELPVPYRKVGIMPNNFTTQELNIIDVALMEFIWSLDSELAHMEMDEQATDQEIDDLVDMLETAEELHDELVQILGELVNEYV